MAYEIVNRTVYPWDTIVYVSVSYIDKLTGRAVSVRDPDSGQLVTGSHATGVVVGRNDVLTAAHVVQAPPWFDQSRYGFKIQVYPGADSSPFSAPFGAYTAAAWANYSVVVDGGSISLEQSQRDFALLGFSEPLGDRLGWMNPDPANLNATGVANATGYPGSGTGMMNAAVTYIRDYPYSVYHTSEDLGVGSSGGPLWYSNASGAYLLGVASSGSSTTATYASLGTPGVMDWLARQMTANDSLLAIAGNAVTVQTTWAYVNTASAVFASARTTDFDDVISADAGYLPGILIGGGGGSDTLRVTGGGGVDLGSVSAVEVLDLRGTTAANSIVRMGPDFTTIFLGPRGDTIRLSTTPAAVYGGEGNDTIFVGPASATLDGGAGIDTMVLPLARAKYQYNSSVPPGSAPPASGVTYTMTNVERVRFADTKVAIDLAPDGNAGQTVQLLGAALGRASISDKQLVAAGLSLFDSGIGMVQASRLVVESDAFRALAGSGDDADFVSLVYANVMGVAPAASDRAYFTGLLAGNGGTMSQAEMLAYAAVSPANQLSINLIGLQQAGVEYA